MRRPFVRITAIADQVGLNRDTVVRAARDFEMEIWQERSTATRGALLDGGISGGCNPAVGHLPIPD